MRVLTGRVVRLADRLLDAVFPPRCAGCGRLGAHFCAVCIQRVVPVAPPWCGSCGASVRAVASVDADARGTLCADCRLDPLPLDGVRSAGLLAGPLRRAVHRLKYRGRSAAAPALAGLLKNAVRQLDGLPADTVVVPVPLHLLRLRERGFNQSEALATPLAAALGLAVRPAVLRIRETPSQVGLSRAARRANLRDAFAATESLARASVLLVDDVVTTGSTLGSAAAACRSQGANAVYAVTLARER